MELMINGREADLSDFEADELAQAVLISLFSWRKSNPDDGIDAPDRQGWWGDTYAVVPGDRIGSRLWLLQREKVTAETIRRAEAYAKEGLQWLIDDRMASRIDVTASRDAVDRIALNVICYKPNGDRIDAVFTKIWG
jgi:phage gp46-like protein|nr:MAG TPA: hypothetical protein [Caudoviricetes sp.]